MTHFSFLRILPGCMRPITSLFLVRPVSGRAGLADPGRTTPPPLPSPRLPSPSLLHCPEQGMTSGRWAWPVSHVLHGESHFTHNYGQRMQQGSAKNSWKEPTHTHASHTRLTHTPSSSGGRCHLLTSIIGQCLIDDSKDFDGQNREDRSRKHFSTSCLCTWTFCISRLTGPGRSRFAGKTLCTRHLVPQVRP